MLNSEGYKILKEFQIKLIDGQNVNGVDLASALNNNQTQRRFRYVNCSGCVSDMVKYLNTIIKKYESDNNI